MDLKSELVLLTGISGAGKSTALFAFEEMGFYCVENIPVPLLKQLFNLASNGDEKYSRMVVSVNLEDAQEAIQLLRKIKLLKSTVVGLYATEESILSRYKLTRHIHPMQTKGLTLPQAVSTDIKLFDHLRPEFDLLIGNTNLTIPEFRTKIFAAFSDDRDSMRVSFVSFGYKHGLPVDVDLVIDTRVLPNPYWDPKLKELTGLDQPVIDYVLSGEASLEFIKKATDYIRYYLLMVKKESRPYYVVGIGCSGGQHRSVVVAEYLSLSFAKEFKTQATHRDVVFHLKKNDE